MSWAVGYDPKWRRDIGYGVPAICDHPGCGAEIDRGLGYVCGGDLYGGEHGCGLHFCGSHLFHARDDGVVTCRQCSDGNEPFTPTPDTAEWLRHKLTDPTWADWRAAEPEEVARIKEALGEPPSAPLPETGGVSSHPSASGARQEEV